MLPCGARRSGRPMHEDVWVIRRSTLLLCLAVTTLAATACSDGGDDSPSGATRVTLPGELPVVPDTRASELAVPLCDDLPDPADSLDWSGAQYSDVAFPTRTRDALILALEFPYVADVWGGTGIREGWIVVGVTGGAVELQTLLDGSYPGARVLAMPSTGPSPSSRCWPARWISPPTISSSRRPRSCR